MMYLVLRVTVDSFLPGDLPLLSKAGDNACQVE